MKIQIQHWIGIIVFLLIGNFALAQNFEWAREFGQGIVNGEKESTTNLAVDASGNVYLTGYFSKQITFDSKGKKVKLTTNGDNDIFVAKYSSNGTFQWGISLGGNQDDRGQGIAVDALGNVYVTGFFQGINVDFDPSDAGQALFTSAGDSRDIFIAKFTNQGAFVWANALGGASSDMGYDIAVDHKNQLYLTGTFAGYDSDFDPSSKKELLNSKNESQDIFLAKYTPEGAYLWAYGFGGTKDDQAFALALDNFDNLLVTGTFQGVGIDFDPGSEVASLNSTGDSTDIFVAKYTAEGVLNWANSVGNAHTNDVGYDIAVDGNGAVFITGDFGGTQVDFDPGTGTAYLQSIGHKNMFIAKYDKNGKYLWAGNTGDVDFNSRGTGITTDTKGNVYTTGYFTGKVDFNFGTENNYLSSKRTNGTINIYFAKYTGEGAFEWVYPLGNGYDKDKSTAIISTLSDHIYLTGFSLSPTQYDVANDANTIDYNGDVFIAKYSTTIDYQWYSAFGIGGIGKDVGNAIASDLAGNTYITGSFENTVSFDPLDKNRSFTSKGSSDIFLIKYNNKGELVWAYQLGGIGHESGLAIALDEQSNIYITGKFDSPNIDFDPGNGITPLINQGQEDIFIAKFSKDGEHIWAYEIGSEKSDAGTSLATDQQGNVYLTGYFSGINVDFNPGIANNSLKTNGRTDIFILKLSNNGDFQWVKSIGGRKNEFDPKIAIDLRGNVVLGGQFEGIIDLDPGIGVAQFVSAGRHDLFIAKYSSLGEYIWAFGTGGSKTETLQDIAVDNIGDIYITGSFEGTTDFNPTATNTLSSRDNSSDIFIAKYTSSGKYIWAHRMGNVREDAGKDITLDGGGNIYITGYFRGDVDFDPSNKQAIFKSSGRVNADIFIAKYSNSGHYQWAQTMGGLEDDVGLAITTNGVGRGYVYATGYFQQTKVDFASAPEKISLDSQGGQDIFYTKIRVSDCSAPTHQAKDIFFSPDINAISLEGFSPSISAADGYLIKINTTNKFTTPDNGGALLVADSAYTKGEQVIYAAEGMPKFPLVITGLEGNTRYYIKVFAFNSCQGYYTFETLGLANSVVTAKLFQTIRFDSLTTKTYGDTPFNLNASTSSNLGVHYTSTNPAVATISGNQVTIIGAGTTQIIARQLGNETYQVAPEVSRTLTVKKANQIINFGKLLPRNFGDSNFSLHAKSNAHLAVHYASSDPSVATIIDSLVTIQGVGGTIITASQAGNNNFNSASAIRQILIVDKAAQIISFDDLPPKTFGDNRFLLKATSSSGLPIYYNSSNPNIATLSKDTLHITRAGTAIITASQPGSSDYAPATSIAREIIINKAKQTISFSLGNDSLKSLNSQPFDLNATASSGLPIYFTSSAPNVATITSNRVQLKSRGKTIITAWQVGNTNYEAAPSVSKELTITIDEATNLRAWIQGRHTVGLNWDIDFSQIRDSRVERSESTPDNFIPIITDNIRSYIDSSLSIRPGITYYYRIIAIGDGGIESLPSNIVGVKIPKEEVVTGVTSTLLKNLQINPNPSSGIFQISWPSAVSRQKVTLVLTDAQGRVLRRYATLPKQINLQRLPSGVYYLNITTSEGEVVKKLVKK